MKRILLIGLGKIAYEYDFPRRTNQDFLTHVYWANKVGSEVILGIDDKEDRCKAFTKVTGISSSVFLEEGLRSNPDIIIISCSAKSHLSVMRKLSALQFRVESLVIEKPIGLNYFQAKEILEMARSISPRIYVNFTREFSTGKKALYSDIREQPSSATIFYGRDLLENGCHYIRLALNFFPLSSKLPSIVVSESSTSLPTFQVTFESTKIDVISIDNQTRFFQITAKSDSEISVIQNNSWYTYSARTRKIEINQIKLEAFGDGMKGLHSELIENKLTESEISKSLDLALYTSYINSCALGEILSESDAINS